MTNPIKNSTTVYGIITLHAYVYKNWEKGRGYVPHCMKKWMECMMMMLMGGSLSSCLSICLVRPSHSFSQSYRAPWVTLVACQLPPTLWTCGTAPQPYEHPQHCHEHFPAPVGLQWRGGVISTYYNQWSVCNEVHLDHPIESGVAMVVYYIKACQIICFSENIKPLLL